MSNKELYDNLYSSGDWMGKKGNPPSNFFERIVDRVCLWLDKKMERFHIISYTKPVCSGCHNISLPYLSYLDRHPKFPDSFPEKQCDACPALKERKEKEGVLI